jgi:hypothetical protein
VGPRADLDRCGKSLPPPGLEPRTVQPVASRYTDYATRPTLPFDPRTVQPVTSRHTHYATRPRLVKNPSHKTASSKWPRIFRHC